MASPDINTEDFQAAVDYLSVQDNVDPEKIGIIGICGWGGMALNAAALDTRIKATVTSTMYDMSRVNAKGYFDAADSAEDRYETKKSLNAIRTEEYRKGTYSRAGGCLPYPAPEDVPFFVKDYSAYYKTERGYHVRSLNSNEGWNLSLIHIFENSDFVYMLNQAGGDRQILAKQLGISPHQLSYVTHSSEGEGLLFYGSIILPFVDHFPKNTELYRIMTTKPQDLAQE